MRDLRLTPGGILLAALIQGLMICSVTAAGEGMGETLYNGIVLPEKWPPNGKERLPLDPMQVPYLDNPPAVIPIDLGRQLFVDDFLIAVYPSRRTRR